MTTPVLAPLGRVSRTIGVKTTFARAIACLSTAGPSTKTCNNNNDKGRKENVC